MGSKTLESKLIPERDYWELLEAELQFVRHAFAVPDDYWRLSSYFETQVVSSIFDLDGCIRRRIHEVIRAQR